MNISAFFVYENHNDAYIAYTSFYYKGKLREHWPLQAALIFDTPLSIFFSVTFFSFQLHFLIRLDMSCKFFMSCIKPLSHLVIYDFFKISSVSINQKVWLLIFPWKVNWIEKTVLTLFGIMKVLKTSWQSKRKSVKCWERTFQEFL